MRTGETNGFFFSETQKKVSSPFGMDSDILDMLEDLGYSGDLRQDRDFNEAINVGPKNIQYTRLIEWICNELKVLCKLDETVNAIITDDDVNNFLLELSSFLKELGCQYSSLIEGHLSERLNNRERRLLLLDYLLSELMAARMIKTDKPHLNKGLEVKLMESSTAAELKSMLLALKFVRPPDNVTPSMLFSKIEEKLKGILKMNSSELLGSPLFIGKLSDKQWHNLQDVQNELQNEYLVRRELLIKRLDVTIQSFLWSEKAKKMEDQIISHFHSHRKKMSIEPNVSLADLLAAREDLAIIEKTSSASVRKNTQSSINKVLIGRVPDRGGRPSEQEAPPPEMPSWQKDRAPGGGSWGGHGSGRVQGNWSHGNQRQDRRNQRDKGNYQGRSYNGNRGYKEREDGRHSGPRDYR